MQAHKLSSSVDLIHLCDAMVNLDRHSAARRRASLWCTTNSHFPNGHVVLVILMAASEIDVMSINVRKWLRFPQFTLKIDEFDLFICIIFFFSSLSISPLLKLDSYMGSIEQKGKLFPCQKKSDKKRKNLGRNRMEL